MSAEAPLAITRQDIKLLTPTTEITPSVPIRPFRMISSSRREVVQESLVAPGLLPMKETVKDIRGSKRFYRSGGSRRRAACPDCRRIYRIREGHSYCSKKSRPGILSQKAA